MLGITRTATEVEIKSAYRKLAMSYHPDRNPDNPDAEDKFKELTEAYAVLADGDKRSLYDRFGHAGVGGAGAAGFDPTISRISATSSASFLGLAIYSEAAGDVAAGLSAGPIYAKTCNWNLTKQFSAPRNRLGFGGTSSVRDVAARERRPAKLRLRAGRAMGEDRFGTSKDFSASRARAQHAKARVA